MLFPWQSPDGYLEPSVQSYSIEGYRPTRGRVSAGKKLPCTPHGVIQINGAAMSDNESGNGIHVIAASSGVDETMARLESLAKQRGLTVFARINFAKDAAAVGLTMQPTQLLILGSPLAGTPLMVAAPGTALDLPLKVLAWQDPSNRCWVSFNTPQYLQQRHGFPAALMANIAGLEKLVQAAVAA
jgi:uncharacterized protein (DUF302 family)